MAPYFVRVILIVVGCGVLSTQSVLASQNNWVNSPLTLVMQKQLDQSRHYLNSRKFSKAEPVILQVLSEASSFPQCLSIASFTDRFGYPMLAIQRKCMEKAFLLCSSCDDYLKVALKSRQYQFYELTHQAITKVIDQTSTLPQLYELSRKCHVGALQDVAHLAMEKAYSNIKTTSEALQYTENAKLLGMEDLERQAARDLINNENNAHQLCWLEKQLEKLEMPDLNRYALRKALDNGRSVEEYVEIFEAARRTQQPDIQKVAAYRAQKLKLINEMKNDGDQDLSAQQAQAEKFLKEQAHPGNTSGF